MRYSRSLVRPGLHLTAGLGRCSSSSALASALLPAHSIHGGALPGALCLRLVDALLHQPVPQRHARLPLALHRHSRLAQLTAAYMWLVLCTAQAQTHLQKHASAFAACCARALMGSS